MRAHLSLLLPLLALAACGQSTTVEAPARPVLAARAVAGDDFMEAYAGEVRARYEAQLAFRVGGKIARRLVDVGSRVEAGTVLAELDPADLELQVESSQAQWEAAQADLELASAERDRAAALIERKLVSQSLLDARETALRAAKARAEQARAQLDAARNQLAYSRLIAPATGVIVGVHAEAGQVVAAGQAVFTLAQDGELEIAIAVPEQRFASVKVGQQVSITLWAHPEARFPGRIRELAPAADAQTRTYAARVTLLAGNDLAELGQSARVFMSDAATPKAVLLPLAAVSAENGEAFAFVIDPATSTLQRRAVSTGPWRADSVPVFAGVQNGEWVVAAGLHLLREGQRVLPIDRDNRPIDLSASAN